MVKHTLAWALIAASSLGAVYGMSNASTEADVTFSDISVTSIVTPPPLPQKRTESGLEYFRFREGYLEWKTQHISTNDSYTQAPIKCYGRTHYFDTQKKKIIEEINDYFSGQLAMSPEDANGFSDGSIHATLRREDMSYTIKCGLFEKTISVSPRDWPSNVSVNEIVPQVQKNSVKSIAAKSSTNDELLAVTIAGKKSLKLKPGSTNTVIAAFTIETKKKVRIAGITFTSPKWFVEPGVLKHMRITIDGKDPDSWNLISGKKTFSFTGLTDYGLFDTVLPGRHLVEIRVSITNTPTKQAYSDTITVSAVQGLAGSGLSLKLKSPVKLQTYTVNFDKKRTKADDDNLAP